MFKTCQKKEFIGLVLIFTIISLLNIPILITLWRNSFDDGTYSHAFLIPFISIYLYYVLVKLDYISFREKLSVPATIFFILSCFLLFLFSTAQISTGYWFALLLTIIASVTMLYRSSWYVIFPALLYIFIFPFWGGLTPYLQNLSVVATTYLMSFTGIPIFVEEQFVTIPAGTFEIAGGCSGLRYFIVSLAMSSLFSFLYLKKAKDMLLLVFVALLGALITNWIRITAIIIIGDYTDMQSSLMKDHNTFGWYLYIPFMFFFMKFANRFVSFDLLYSKPIANSFKSKPKSTIIIGTLFLALISSSTIHSYIYTEQTSTLFEIPSKIPNKEIENIKPTIFFYSSVKQVPLPNDSKINYQVYDFDGSDLDGKPTFYGNDYIPEGWRTQKTSIKDDWKISIIYKGLSKAVVFTSFEIDQQRYPQRRSFKIKRLTKALKGVDQTKLHWAFIACEVSCEQTISSAKLLLN